MGFVIIVNENSKEAHPEKKPEVHDEFVDIQQYRRAVLFKDGVYVSIKKNCRKNNVHNFMYTVMMGEVISELYEFNFPCRINIGISDDYKKIRIKSQEDGSRLLRTNSKSTVGVVSFTLPHSIREKEMRTTEVDLEDMSKGEIIINLEKAIMTHGY